MSTLVVIIGALLIYVVALLIIVCVPVLFGRLFLKWTKNRAKYIISQTAGDVMTSLIASLVISGLGLLVGIIFKQEWAFSGGLLFVWVFWVAIKATRKNIKASVRIK